MHKCYASVEEDVYASPVDDEDDGDGAYDIGREDHDGCLANIHDLRTTLDT